jgi:hypothetical protein
METEKEPRVLWTYAITGNYIHRSKKTVKRYLDRGLIEGFKVTENGRPLVYADTVTEQNLNAVKPKFLNKSKK